MTLRAAFLWTLIASLSLAAALGIVAILMPNLIGADEEILGTSLLLGLHSLPPLACSIVISRRRVRWAMWMGIVCSPIAWALWMPLIWSMSFAQGYRVEVALVKSAFTLLFLAIWAAHLGLLTLMPLDRPIFRNERIGTLIMTAIVLLIGTPAMWWEWDHDWFWRGFAVLCILAGCGTVITPIFSLLDALRRRASRESIATDTKVRLFCPRCNAEQTLRVGPNRCSECGLHIETKVEEPRCRCGYLLFKLEGDQCPECGRTARCACGCLVDGFTGTCPKCGTVNSIG